MPQPAQARLLKVAIEQLEAARCGLRAKQREYVRLRPRANGHVRLDRSTAGLKSTAAGWAAAGLVVDAAVAAAAKVAGVASAADWETAAEAVRGATARAAVAKAEEAGSAVAAALAADLEVGSAAVSAAGSAAVGSAVVSAAGSAAAESPAMMIQAAAAAAPEAVTGRDRAPSTWRWQTAKAQRGHGRAYLARRAGSAPSARCVSPFSGGTRRRTARWRTGTGLDALPKAAWSRVGTRAGMTPTARCFQGSESHAPYALVGPPLRWRCLVGAKTPDPTTRCRPRPVPAQAAMASLRNAFAVLALAAVGAKAQTPAPWPGVGACHRPTGTPARRATATRAPRAAALGTAARGLWLEPPNEPCPRRL